MGTFALKKGTVLSRKQKKALAESLWKKIIKISGRCVFCGIPEDRSTIDAAHILPKGAYPDARHDIENGLPLCRSCHRYATDNPDWFTEKVIEFIGQEKYQELRERYQKVVVNDLDEIIDGLKIEYDRLKLLKEQGKPKVKTLAMCPTGGTF